MIMNKIIYTYRYIIKKANSEKDNTLFVVMHTGDESFHDCYMESLVADNDIISCIREYVCEYDIDKIAQVFPVKEKKEKEGEKDE